MVVLHRSCLRLVRSDLRGHRTVALGRSPWLFHCAREIPASHSWTRDLFSGEIWTYGGGGFTFYFPESGPPRR
ncbi:hypothetical protein L484_019974 [Morus notabilis]|uniref:Uncharacterized protein n=1 Tax=Morus notabilis TaxID=981085 RepID=W9R573_9ROSA|nr:hypothetical protein L484_019974 [Morus notabilis]